LALDLLDELQPVATRHGIVEDRDVPVELARELERVVTVFRLADHDHILLGGQDLSQASPDYRVIVCNQDSDGRAPFSGAVMHSLLQREWNRHLYPSSSVPGCSDLDASAKRKRPLSHAQDPQGFGIEPGWIVDTLAVVLDLEHENALVDPH